MMEKKETMHEDNFLELESREEANKVNQEVYSFIRFSEKRNRYIFKRRAGWVRKNG